MTIARVLLTSPHLPYLDYLIPEELDISVGDFVLVPIKSKISEAIVFEILDSSSHKNLKTIIEKLPIPAISKALCQYIEQTANYTLSPAGSILKMVMPIASALKPKHWLNIKDNEVSYNSPNLPNLNDEQQLVVNDLLSNLNNKFYPVMLDGVTGSGKTEVYFYIIKYLLDHTDKQILVMLPEICLTAQWLKRFNERFGINPTIWHSSIKEKERRQAWQNIVLGKARIIVGTRSALFLPYHKLGLIVIDEEHDASYKQEERVIYNARDFAVLRAKYESIPIILASATPSLESWYNAISGKYHLLSLKERHFTDVMPDIEIVNVCSKNKKQGWLSPNLVKALRHCLEKNEQSMLFLNRRGYAPLTLCYACGHHLMCKHCSTWLVEHKYPARLECHHCGYSTEITKDCPKCEEENTMIACGPGVERIAEEVKKSFPKARLAIMTRDTINTPEAADQLIDEITSHNIDIIIGTQMVTKGLHFPLLQLVGVIDADIGMVGGDLRAAERTYQLLHQVSGRAGREKENGKVIIQTFNPENPLIKALVSNNREDFFNYELSCRKQAKLPPFGKLVSIVISGRSRENTLKYARNFVKSAPKYDQAMVLGPIEAPLATIRGWHRYRILVQGSMQAKTQEYIKSWLLNIKIPSYLKVTIDIDPYSFY